MFSKEPSQIETVLLSTHNTCLNGRTPPPPPPMSNLANVFSVKLNIFLPFSLTICFGCSQHVFVEKEENNYQIHTLIWRPALSHPGEILKIFLSGALVTDLHKQDLYCPPCLSVPSTWLGPSYSDVENSASCQSDLQSGWHCLASHSPELQIEDLT